MVIGVLALQGAFSLHRPHLEAIPNVSYLEVVNKGDLEKIDGLILPGGESGVMLKLIQHSDLLEPLQKYINEKPVWGICAGAILMADKVLNPEQFCFKVMKYTIERNFYGRQNDSFFADINNYQVSFIRAPKVINCDSSLIVLHQHNQSPTWVQSQNKIATMFHPETNLNFPSPWHQAFVKIVDPNHI
jgi:pyridoxal 5'-phosphate synthase pdxT subunit